MTTTTTTERTTATATTTEERPRTPADIPAILREIHALDWTPDAAYPKQGRPVRYVTTAKIKRQITPILDRHGLYIRISMDQPPTMDGSCAIVRYDASITDGTEHYIPATIYGEGNNDPGKRILTATTNAYRIYTQMAFGIIDGMEDDVPVSTAPETRIRPIAEHPRQAAEDGPQGQNTPPAEQKPDPLSGLLRQAVESAYRAILTSPTVTSAQRDEARARYEAIADSDGATQFLAFKREVIH